MLAGYLSETTKCIKIDDCIFLMLRLYSHAIVGKVLTKEILTSGMKMDNHQLREHLYECLRREVMVSDKPFSWLRTLHRACKYYNRRFNFWWRIANHLYKKDSGLLRWLAERIQIKLIRTYGAEIELRAHIAPGLSIRHFCGIVINGYAEIGENFDIRQNTTIGTLVNKKHRTGNIKITIGDNVFIGANSCIIGDNITIGSNVIIGAMSFINQDIPDNCTVFTEKKIRKKPRDNTVL